LYSDIVKEYREFSGELLQVMLGLEILKDTNETRPDAIEMIPKEDVEAPTVSRADKKYSRLTPDAQSIIISGRLSKSVQKMDKEEDAGHITTKLPFN
jgi:hypothetical protein